MREKVLTSRRPYFTTRRRLEWQLGFHLSSSYVHVNYSIDITGMFTEARYSEAKAVMKRIMEHPVAKFFYEPLHSEEDDPLNLTNPSGFREIVDKLDNKSYTSVTEWYNDIETLCHNIEEYYSETSFEAVCAAEVRRIFTKEKCKAQQVSKAGWIYAIQKQRLKLARARRTAPTKVRVAIPTIASVDLPVPRTLPYTEHERQEFLLGLEEMNDTSDAAAIAELIDESQPGVINTPSTVSLAFGQLTDTTLEKIRNYVMKRKAHQI